MRRGHTLIELLVSLAVLATLGSVTLRLMFAGDRALQTNSSGRPPSGAALRLLHDVSDDLRAGLRRRASGGSPVIQRPDGRVELSAPCHGQPVRRTAGDVVEDYPGVKLAVGGGGRLRTVTVAGKGTEAEHAWSCPRRGG